MKVFVEQNNNRDIAYSVCRSSIVTRNSDVDVDALNKDTLISEGVYKRTEEHLNFSKFLIPLLMEHQGWALYCKDTMVFIDDIRHIFSFKDDRYAAMIVKHQNLNNDNSMILWNCDHPANAALTADYVNNQSPDALNSFVWLKPEEIGELHYEWNWLVGHYTEPQQGKPKGIEFINGGPWQDEHKNTAYGLYWERERNEYVKSSIGIRQAHRFENLPEDINQIVDKMIEYRMDSNNEYYKTTKQDLINEIETNLSPQRVFAVDSEFRYARKGNIYDPMLENFIIGAGGQITTWDMIENDKSPVVIRGIAKRKQIHSCWETGRDFYYIDTGYFGNGKRKLYHRITKNHLQNIYPVVSRPRDRLSATGWRPSKFRGGRNILICPPSAKVMKFFDLDLDQWMEQTLATIKQHTDRPVVIRLKQSRSARMHDDTLAMALSKDVHCLVTFNSIAATEALLLGKPAITLGPNAAQALCKQDLSHIEKPYIPSLDEVEEWAAHLSYAQFTELEMRSGYAWAILNENSNLPSSSPQE